MNPLIQLKKATPVFLVAFGLACFVLLPTAHAVVPAPDGGYGPPTYGTGNTAEGQNALLSLTTGSYNTGVGLLSLRNNATTSLNTAIGAGALLANTADQNTATGAVALFHNTTGTYNTANGALALFSNTSGNNNTASGTSALNHNTIGFANTATGVAALNQNTNGFYNTANGFYALFNNTSGSGNIALGSNAGSGVTTASGVICIGAAGGNVNNSCFIGHIYGVMSGFGTAVYVNSSGQLFTINSSQRFKDNIKPMDKASDALLALKPVTFHYKNDKTNTPQFGLIAEEVAEVNPDLVVRDENGEIYTVRYDAVNAMLLNEFLKEHQKVQELEKQVEKLTAGLQKISDRLELSKAAPQMVNNP